jgi:nitrous oxidase accessory protein NosD
MFSNNIRVIGNTNTRCHAELRHNAESVATFARRHARSAYSYNAHKNTITEIVRGCAIDILRRAQSATKSAVTASLAIRTSQVRRNARDRVSDAGRGNYWSDIRI